MKQINIVNAYIVTNNLIQKDTIPIQGKWILFKLRKDLLSYYEFYIEESKKLLNQYEVTQEESTLKFTNKEFANEYVQKQNKIDNLEVEINIEKQKCKLSDIPEITVLQMEALDSFIEFMPE